MNRRLVSPVRRRPSSSFPRVPIRNLRFHMDLRCGPAAELFANRISKCRRRGGDELASDDDDVFDSIILDDAAAKLLHLCCNFLDSPYCAAGLLAGDLGTAPAVSDLYKSEKLPSPLQTAVRRARTDGQLALDLSLSSTRTEYRSHSVGDLVVLGEIVLTAVRLAGLKMNAPAALLIVAAESKMTMLLELELGSQSGCKGIGAAQQLDFLTDDGAEDFGFKRTDYREEIPSSGHKLKPAKHASNCVHPSFLRILKPDSLLHGRKEFDADDERGCCIVSNKGSTTPREDPRRYLALQSLTRTWNKLPRYFLGHFVFNKNLLLEDTNGIQYSTEIQETPLLFAVKNASMECAEILLSWGALSDIFNRCRQRPVILTTLQKAEDHVTMADKPVEERPFKRQKTSQSSSSSSSDDESEPHEADDEPTDDENVESDEEDLEEEEEDDDYLLPDSLPVLVAGIAEQPIRLGQVFNWEDCNSALCLHNEVWRVLLRCEDRDVLNCLRNHVLVFNYVTDQTPDGYTEIPIFDIPWESVLQSRLQGVYVNISWFPPPHHAAPPPSPEV